MKTRVTLNAFVLLSFAALVSQACGQEDQTQPSFWMQKKLEYSERILAGLVSRDFDRMAKTAHSMGALSHIEKWVHGNTKEYRAQLQVFQNANDQLERMAENENLDGAALAYVQLTLSCVNCHKVVRDGQRGSAPDK
jgi:hypothetical protein